MSQTAKTGWIAGLIVLGIAASVAWITMLSRGKAERAASSSTGPNQPVPQRFSGRKLTSDQAIAWAKVRRQRRLDNEDSSISYQVAGYIARTSRWKMRSLDLSGFDWRDGLGFSYADIFHEGQLVNITSKEEMFQGILRQAQAELKSIEKKAQQDVTRIGKIHPGTEAELSAKKRQIEELQQLLSSIKAEKLEESKKPQRFRVRSGLKDAEEAAKEAARSPGVKATVILDLYSHEFPTVIKCLADNGREVVGYPDGVNDDLNATLQDFLFDLVSNANRVR